MKWCVDLIYFVCKMYWKCIPCLWLKHSWKNFPYIFYGVSVQWNSIVNAFSTIWWREQHAQWLCTISYGTEKFRGFAGNEFHRYWTIKLVAFVSNSQRGSQIRYQMYFQFMLLFVYFSSKTEIWNELSHMCLQIQSPKLAFRCYEIALNFLHSAIQFSFLSFFLLKWNSV